MELELFVRFLHIIGAMILFGTGIGIAFFMLLAHRTKDAKTIAHVAGSVVIADTIFTATAVIIQPITGVWLALNIGWPIASGWVGLSILLYIVTGLFWLPVVAIQLAMRNLARKAALEKAPLPQKYFTYFRIWFFCGFPAFAAVIAIIWLMLTKPDIAFSLL